MDQSEEVSDILTTLVVSTIGMIIGGFLAVWTALAHPGRVDGGLLIVGGCFVVFGIFLSVLAVEFYRLKPWTYKIVKFLLTGPLRLHGPAGRYEKTMTSPTMLRTFRQPVPGKPTEQRQ